MYAAAVRCHWNVTLFTVFGPPDFGLENGLSYVTKSWSRRLLSTPPQHVSQLLESNSTICSYQIIIICTLESSRLQEVLDVIMNVCDKRASYLVLLQLHRGRRDIPQFEKIFDKFPSLSSQKRVEVRYVAFAEHVKNYAEHNIKYHFGIDIWRPVFPLDLPVHAEEDQYHQYFDFAIQGILEHRRRNYFGFAAEVKRLHNILRQHRVVFTILGLANTLDRHEYLKLPGVRLFLPPNYMPANVFFGFIHQAVGIIPIFGVDNYYIDVQSSSIVSSILTQTPLIASRRLLVSHKYIPEESVWLKHDNETDIAAILRMVTSFPSVAAFRKALFTKRQRLKQLLEESYMNNERTLNDYASALERRTM